jgi:hypothetical protein
VGAQTAPHDPHEWWKWDYARNKPMLDEWASVWALIPPDVRARIGALHEEHKYECCGYSEGQFCCIDFLDGSADQSYQDQIRKTCH